jgi:hypothetical protein
MATADDYAAWIVANKDKAGSPEFNIVAEAYKQAKGQTVTQPNAPAEISIPEKIAGSAPVRFAIGAAEPILGAVQMGANALPDSWGAGKAVNEHISTLNDMIEKGRGADAGFDAVRFGGNVFSPVNAGLAKALPAAGTALGRAAVGTAAGAVGGATTPVTDGVDDFWQKKAAQTGIGAVTGGVLTPVIGKLADAVAPKISSLIAKFSADKSVAANAKASMQADQAIEQALREIGAKADDIGANEMNLIRQQVRAALKEGKQLDGAALLRKMDFDAIGVTPTQGQLTRDATQFAKERNLRQVPNVGEPLLNRFETQNQQLQSLIAKLKGSPSEPYQAGKTISDSLRSTDAAMKGKVDSAYNAARDNVGRAAPMDAYAFSQKANLALDDGMLGHYLPAEVKGILNDVSSGKIPLNVNTAVQIDSVLSAAQRSAGQGTPQSLAISKVRDALNSAPIENSLGEDAKKAFDAARGMARQRFSLHDAIPALKAAADGEAPDKFVQQYVIGGNVDEVKRLAELLKKTNPDAFQEARAQIGDKITRAAFGENTAGDKLATPERLASVLRQIGTDKLSAFYTPAEIAQFKTASRVAAYINSTPAAAPVQTSNNFGAITQMASKIPGSGMAVGLANALRSVGANMNNQSAVDAALRAEIRPTSQLDPEKAKALARFLTIGAAGAGAAGAVSFR